MASLFKRGKYYWIQWTINGKRYRESLFPLTYERKQDEKLATVMLQQKSMEEAKALYRPILKKLSPLSIDDAIDDFMKPRSQLRPKTIESYENAFTVFKNFLGNDNRKVGSITPQLINDYENWLTQNNKARNTVVSYLKMLKILFQMLVLKGYLTTNPVQGKYKRVKMPINVIPDHIFDNIAKELLKQNVWRYRLVKCLRYSGLRTGEACALKWEDFDWNNGILNIRNTKAGRVDQFPLYSRFKNFMIEFKKDSGLVFPFGDNRKLRWFEDTLERLKLKGKYSLHDLRRTFGTEMARKLNIYQLKDVMRHEDIRTTASYYIYVDISKTGKKM